jgi:hypothetical protein
MDATGCSWNGLYGVVDTYGTFSAPVQVPGRDLPYIIDSYTQAAMWSVGEKVNFLPYHTPYRWVRDKITLGLMARWKAVYVARGYAQTWSVLQSLRAILGQPSDDLVQLPDGTGATQNWSARELIRVLQLRPMWAKTYPYFVAEQNYSVFHLVQRFDLIARGTWVTPADDDAFDQDERLNHTVVTQRPVSFRERLGAATT